MLFKRQYGLYSLQDLIQWVQQQPDQIYVYIDPSRCLIANYLKDRQVEKYILTSQMIRDAFGEKIHDAIQIGTRTYKEALNRLLLLDGYQEWPG